MSGARAVAINLDLGELDDEPQELFDLATTCNLACGGHAGDAASMALAVRRAGRAVIAAHPSYPDRARFGRVALAMANDALHDEVFRQCAALGEVARACGRFVTALKPHGALYHVASRDLAVARCVVEAATRALEGGLEIVVGPPVGALADAARALRITYAREGFADRAYRADGTLVPRAAPGALIDDPEAAAAQALRLARAGACDTVCVHGDGPNALPVARAVHAALASARLLVRRGEPFT